MLRNIVIRLITKHAGTVVSRASYRRSWRWIQFGGRVARSNDALSIEEMARKHLQVQVNFNLDQTLKTWEQAYVEAAFKITSGNLSQAAKLLGINRTTLYSRMHRILTGNSDVSRAFWPFQSPFKITAHTDFFYAAETGVRFWMH